MPPAVKALREFGPFDSFKVHAKRSNTDYELTSIDFNRPGWRGAVRGVPR